MTTAVIVNFKRQRVYVRLKDNQFVSAHLPGDYMNITDQLSAKDKRTLEKRAMSRALIERGTKIIGRMQ